MFRQFLLGFLALLLTAAPAAAQLYDVRTGDVSYEKKAREALKIQVDGQASSVREYFKDWMKQSYNVRFKQGGVFGIGKSDALAARQTPASTISGSPSFVTIPKQYVTRDPPGRCSGFQIGRASCRERV